MDSFRFVSVVSSGQIGVGIVAVNGGHGQGREIRKHCRVI